MVRSLVGPRQTDPQCFFCAGMPAPPAPPTPPAPPAPPTPPAPLAELVASVLKVGGLLDANCNPGSATPEMLHRIYNKRGAASANPCILRELQSNNATIGNGMYIGNLNLAEKVAEREALISSSSDAHVNGIFSPAAVVPQPLFQPARRRADSPPRGHFLSLNREHPTMRGAQSGACSARCLTSSGVQLTMDSLKFGGSKPRPR